MIAGHARVNQHSVEIEDVQLCLRRTTRSLCITINDVFTAAAAASSSQHVEVAAAAGQCVRNAKLRQVARSTLDED